MIRVNKKPVSRIFFHGNCQAAAMAELLRPLLPNIEVNYCEVFSVDLKNDQSRVQKLAETADVIFLQPISDKYRGVDWLSSSSIRRFAQPCTKIVTFPSITFAGYHPSTICLNGLPEFPLAYHDAHLIDHFLRGLPSDEYIDSTSEADFYNEDFSRSEIFLTIDELIRRESANKVDVLVSDIILANFRTKLLFLTPNHPSLNLLSKTLNELLIRAEIEGCITDSGGEPLDKFIIPVLLSTAANLNLEIPNLWIDDYRAEWKWHSREDFTEISYDFYRSIGHDRLNSAWIVSSGGRAFLQRYKRTHHLNSAFSEKELVVTLFDIFLDRSVSGSDVAAHIARARKFGWSSAIRMFIDEPEFHARGAAQFKKRFIDPE